MIQQDLDLVWGIITKNLPELKQEIEKLLQKRYEHALSNKSNYKRK